MQELIYTEHRAGEFKDGLQICTLCGRVISDYTGSWASSSGEPPKGFIEGPIWIKDGNPMEFTTIKPLVNYGGDDPYTRRIVKCS